MKRTYENKLNFITLFLTIDFLTDDRLFRKLLVSLLVKVVNKRTWITPIELSIIASVLIYIGCRIWAFFNLSYANILSVFTVQLKKNHPLSNKNGLLQNTFWFIWTTKLVKHLIVVQRKSDWFSISCFIGEKKLYKC